MFHRIYPEALRGQFGPDILERTVRYRDHTYTPPRQFPQTILCVFLQVSPLHHEEISQDSLFIMYGKNTSVLNKSDKIICKFYLCVFVQAYSFKKLLNLCHFALTFLSVVNKDYIILSQKTNKFNQLRKHFKIF